VDTAKKASTGRAFRICKWVYLAISPAPLFLWMYPPGRPVAIYDRWLEAIMAAFPLIGLNLIIWGLVSKRGVLFIALAMVFDIYILLMFHFGLNYARMLHGG